MATAATSVQDQIFSKLKISLEGQKAQAAFCCGGSSEINDELSRPDIRFKQAPPVTLHCAPGDERSVLQIVFSQAASSTEQFTNDIRSLTDSCQPASFGKEGKDVFDESYRKAVKLDSTHFTTNFHPHDYGILQDIERILLPAFEKGLKSDSTILVQAELYKLNVYSGPGGKFKAHVDTPRGREQFGSLVVCLPSAHQGGALAIRHNGRAMSFDWSSKHPKSIEWAAFFSDCEHEVADLTSGHRVTLTYNLYTASAAMPRPMRSIKIDSFPLYWEVMAALRNRDFLVNGGTIGFFCNHFYAQNYHKSPEVLPQALKGIDMIIHAVTCALRLPINICPIMDKPRSYDDSDEGDEEIAEDETREIQTPAISQRQMELTSPDVGSSTSISEKQKVDVAHEKEKIRFTHKSGQDIADPSHRSFKKTESLVGRGFKKFALHRDERIGEDISAAKFMRDEWPHDRKSIYWVTEKQQAEVALAFMTYGNDASVDCSYSAAAILVDIPAWSEKRGVI